MGYALFSGGKTRTVKDGNERTADCMKPLTVGETARLTGVSVRTLHYYDEIGLLHPSGLSEGGYRLYDGARLARLQQILFFREMDLPLEEIGRILDSPAFDSRRAMERHRALLSMKAARLERLIGLVDNILKGEADMDFKPFDASELEQARAQYEQEARERWGNTAAYAQSAEKTRAYGNAEWEAIGAQSESIYRGLAACMGEGPASPRAQSLVGQWQALITRSFYDCSNDMLACLGEMYVEDERFTRNIDRYAPGLAAFLRDAIRVYCGQAGT